MKCKVETDKVKKVDMACEIVGKFGRWLKKRFKLGI